MDLREAFKKSSVVVVGDTSLDQYWHSTAETISPEAPIPVSLVHDEVLRLGGAAHVANVVATLGAEASLFTVVGDDNRGKIVKKLLKKTRIVDESLVLPEHETRARVRVLISGHQVARCDFENKVDINVSHDLLASYRKLHVSSSIAVFSDEDKGTLFSVSKFISAVKAKKNKVLIDPCFPDLSRYRGANFIVPNEKELESTIGAWITEETLNERTQNLLKHCDFDAVFLTRGAQGITLFCKGGKPKHYPTSVQSVTEITSAGEAVVGTLAAAIGGGLSLENAAIVANVSAELTIKQIGTSSIEVSNLLAVIEQRKMLVGN
jgi:rfaE bifunctional protein kinase chain/domain